MFSPKRIFFHPAPKNLTALAKFFVVFVLLLAVALPQFSYAAEKYQAGNILYVAPPAGVNIRTMPSLKAPVQAKLSYNTKVTVLADSLPATALQIKVTDFNDGFLNLQGHWVKVKSGSTIGYVFDGMLSKYKGLALDILQEEPYYADTFGTPKKNIIKQNQIIEGNKVDYETIIKTYPRGMVEEYTFFDGCHDLTYTFSTSFNEAYWLIARMFLKADAVQDAKIKEVDKNTILTYYSCT